MELLRSNEALFDKDRQIVAWPKQAVNDMDVISQNDLRDRNPLYMFMVDVSPSETATLPNPRRVHRFDPVSLVEMILKTGDLFNPYTRKPLSSQE